MFVQEQTKLMENLLIKNHQVFARCRVSFGETTDGSVKLTLEHNRPTCSPKFATKRDKLVVELSPMRYYDIWFQKLVAAKPISLCNLRII